MYATRTRSTRERNRHAAAIRLLVNLPSSIDQNTGARALAPTCTLFRSAHGHSTAVHPIPWTSALSSLERFIMACPVTKEATSRPYRIRPRFITSAKLRKIEATVAGLRGSRGFRGAKTSPASAPEYGRAAPDADRITDAKTRDRSRLQCARRPAPLDQAQEVQHPNPAPYCTHNCSARCRAAFVAAADDNASNVALMACTLDQLPPHCRSTDA